MNLVPWDYAERVKMIVTIFGVNFFLLASTNVTILL